jgi:hypothetical protein
VKARLTTAFLRLAGGHPPRMGKRRSLREIAAELAKLGYLNERGQVFNPKNVKSMLEQ